MSAITCGEAVRAKQRESSSPRYADDEELLAALARRVLFGALVCVPLTGSSRGRCIPRCPARLSGGRAPGRHGRPNVIIRQDAVSRKLSRARAELKKKQLLSLEGCFLRHFQCFACTELY